MTTHTTPRPNAPRTIGAAAVLGVAALLAATAAACTGGGVPPPTVGGAGTPPTTAGPASPSPGLEASMPPAEGAVPAAIVQAAIDDAATRAGVDPGSVTVTSAQAVTWPNGALGCPQPGMLYTEVITPGYHVVVEAGGTPYDYRASARGGGVAWCENPPPSS
jgi:hypothetical protein